MARQQQLLIVEDDRRLREEIRQYLTDSGYTALSAANASEMERVLASTPIDLILLDIVLPGEDGLSICRRLAQNSRPAIIIISGRGEEIDRVLGLELGADDYLAKPFPPRELLARIRAVLRRSGEADIVDRPPQESYRFSGFMFDAAKGYLRAPNGASILLTPGERALLVAFVNNPRRALSRDQLIEAARGETNDVFDRAIDVQISRLRRKLQAGADEELIKTVRRIGYVFDCGVMRVQ